MNYTPILASDMTAALPWFVVVPVYAGFFGLVSLLLNISVGRRRWWGLLISVIPLFVGLVSLFLLLSLFLFGSGAHPIFLAMVLFPLVTGLGGVLLCLRENPKDRIEPGASPNGGGAARDQNNVTDDPPSVT